MNWKNSIVRIIGEKDRSLGTGFLASQSGLILTATHVLEPLKPDSKPIQLAFLVQPDKVYEASIECELIKDEGDITVLKVNLPLPDHVVVPALGKTVDIEPHRFATVGFPIKPDFSSSSQENASGTIEGITRQQLDSPKIIQFSSSDVRRGYSGAPVWDEKRQCIVGVISFITLADEIGRAPVQGYATSLEAIFDTYKGIEPSEVCPFKGLNTFTQADATYYYGRETQIEEAVAKLIAHPSFLAVLGPSGSGKSSLVLAGILPALQAGRVHDSKSWDIFVIRPKEDPFIQLQAYLPITEDLVEAVQKHLDRYKETKRVVLVIDQFEQLFTGAGESTKAEFVRALETLMQSQLPVSVIITLRNDFQSAVKTASHTLADLVKTHFLYLSHEFSRDQLKDMIEKPAQSVGLQFEGGLVDQLIQDVMQTSQIGAADQQARQRATLPLLEFALERIWQLWYRGATDNVLANESYKAIGGITGSLTQWADAAYNELDKSPLVKRIFLDLSYVSNMSFTTRPRLVKELTRTLYDSKQPNGRISKIYDFLLKLPLFKSLLSPRRHYEDQIKQDKETTLAILDLLASKRLIVIDAELSPNSSGTETVEIIHDALLIEWTTLATWLRDSMDQILARQDFENRAQTWVKDKSADLLGRKDYSRARSSLKMFDLLPEQNRQFDTPLHRFLIASKRRLLLIWSAMSVIALILLAAAGMTGIWEWQVAQAKREAMGDVAEFNELLASTTNTQSSMLAPFVIDRYEVTYAQHRLCVQFGPCEEPTHDWPPNSGLDYDYSIAPDNFPVQSVSAVEAATFCDWIGRRLPTAFEYEFAARGHERRSFPWSNTLPDQETIRVNIIIDYLYELIDWDNLRPVAVNDENYLGSATPGTGIMHLLGNVREWTSTTGDCDGLCDEPWTLTDELPGRLQLMGHSYATGSVSESSLDDEKFLFDDFTEPDFPDETIGFRCAKSK